jgi:hypothetical protein
VTRYRDRLASGLCTRCGAEPHRLDRTTCPTCAEYDRERGKLTRQAANRRREAFRRALAWRLKGRLMGGPTP